jgi:hypothetical protein
MARSLSASQHSDFRLGLIDWWMASDSYRVEAAPKSGRMESARLLLTYIAHSGEKSFLAEDPELFSKDFWEYTQSLCELLAGCNCS